MCTWAHKVGIEYAECVEKTTSKTHTEAISKPHCPLPKFINKHTHETEVISFFVVKLMQKKLGKLEDLRLGLGEQIRLATGIANAFTAGKMGIVSIQRLTSKSVEYYSSKLTKKMNTWRVYCSESLKIFPIVGQKQLF